MKKILIAIVLAFTITACGTANLGSKMKNVEIGMTKTQLASALGNSYDTLSAVKTPEGTLETRRYWGALSDYNYIVNLLDGKVVEWYQESIPTEGDGRHRH